MKPRPGEPVQVKFANIRSGKVEVEFARLDEDVAAEANGEPANEEEA
jgi:ribosome maturation factor RimP